jgi:hypothetical protein
MFDFQMICLLNCLGCIVHMPITQHTRCRMKFSQYIWRRVKENGTLNQGTDVPHPRVQQYM